MSINNQRTSKITKNTTKQPLASHYSSNTQKQSHLQQQQTKNLLKQTPNSHPQYQYNYNYQFQTQVADYNFDNFYIDINQNQTQSQLQFGNDMFFQNRDSYNQQRFMHDCNQSNFCIEIKHFDIQEYLDIVNKGKDKFFNCQYMESSIISSSCSELSQQQVGLSRFSQQYSQYTVISSQQRQIQSSSSSSSSASSSSSSSSSCSQDQPQHISQKQKNKVIQNNSLKNKIKNKSKYQHKIRDQKYQRSSTYTIDKLSSKAFNKRETIKQKIQQKQRQRQKYKEKQRQRQRQKHSQKQKQRQQHSKQIKTPKITQSKQGPTNKNKINQFATYDEYKAVGKKYSFQNNVLSLIDDFQVKQKQKVQPVKKVYPRLSFSNLGVPAAKRGKNQKQGVIQKIEGKQKQKEKEKEKNIGPANNNRNMQSDKKKKKKNKMRRENKKYIIKPLDPNYDVDYIKLILGLKADQKQKQPHQFQKSPKPQPPPQNTNINIKTSQILPKQNPFFVFQTLKYYKRPPQLQHILHNHHNHRSELINYILKNNPYLQNIQIKLPQPPYIPNQFYSLQQYQNTFLYNLKCQLVYQLRQKFVEIKYIQQNQNNVLSTTQIKPNQQPQKQQKITRLFNLTITHTQKLQNQQLYELTASIKLDNFDNKAYKILKDLKKNHKSKYRFYVMYSQGFGMEVCQVRSVHKQGFQNNRDGGDGSKQVWIRLITGRDVYDKNQSERKFSDLNVVLYDIGKITTQARQFQAVTNMKYFPISSYILNPIYYPIFSQKCQIFQKSSQKLSTLVQILHNFYNKSQITAINQISKSNQGIQLLQGPPGTGKTSTLIGILSCQYLKLTISNKQIQSHNNNKTKNKQKIQLTNPKPNLQKQKQNDQINNLKILICTPSNSAIDLITNKIIQEGLFSGIEEESNQGLNMWFKMKQCGEVWSGMRRHWLETQIKNNIVILNQQQVDKFQKKNSQKNQNKQSKQSLNYRVYPRIIRVGLSQSEQHNKIKTNTTNYTTSISKIQPIPAYNFNLQHIMNSLFSQQLQRNCTIVTKYMLSNKIDMLKGQIRKIKQTVTNIVSSTFTTSMQNDNLQSRQRYDKYYDSVVNGLYNMIWIKSTCVEELSSLMKKPPKMHKHIKYNENNHQLKDVLIQLETALINSTEIILTTLTSSFSQKILYADPNFTTLIVDQAAQATQPNLLIPLQYGIKKLILIGDQCQLPPTIKNCDLLKNRYNRSLFERIWQKRSSQNAQNNYSKIYMLDTQYRMNSLIRAFPSQKFYSNKLKDSQSVNQRKNVKNLVNDGLHLSQVNFIDSIKGRQQKYANSYINKVQGQCVVEIVCNIMKVQIQRFRQKKQSKQLINIGIITPYSQQQKYIKSLFKIRKQQLLKGQNLQFLNNETGHSANILPKIPQITVSTVDSYQGQERDIIIISTVRSNLKGNVGFLNDERRINVALTRAKYAVLIIGNQKTLSTNSIWNSYIGWVKRNGLFFTYEGAEAGNNNNLSQLIKQVFQESKSKKNKNEIIPTQSMNKSFLWSVSYNQQHSNDLSNAFQAEKRENKNQKKSSKISNNSIMRYYQK